MFIRICVCFVDKIIILSTDQNGPIRFTALELGPSSIKLKHFSAIQIEYSFRMCAHAYFTWNQWIVNFTWNSWSVIDNVARAFSLSLSDIWRSQCCILCTNFAASFELHSFRQMHRTYCMDGFKSRLCTGKFVWMHLCRLVWSLYGSGEMKFVYAEYLNNFQFLSQQSTHIGYITTHTHTHSSPGTGSGRKIPYQPQFMRTLFNLCIIVWSPIFGYA